MKIIEIGNKVLEELDLPSDYLSKMQEVLGMHENFINSMFTYVLSLPDLEKFFFENDNNNWKSVVDIVVERSKIEFECENEMDNFILLHGICSSVSGLMIAIFCVLGRICSLPSVKSITVSLRENKTIGVRAVYED